MLRFSYFYPKLATLQLMAEDDVEFWNVRSGLDRFTVDCTYACWSNNCVMFLCVPRNRTGDFAGRYFDVLLPPFPLARRYVREGEGID